MKLHPDIEKALTDGSKEELEIADLIEELREKVQKRFGGHWHAKANFEGKSVLMFSLDD